MERPATQRRSGPRAGSRRWWVVLCAALVVALPGAGSGAAGSRDAGSGAVDDAVRMGVVTYPDRTAMASQLGALRGLGLEVQGLRRLPMALVQGTPEQLARVDESGRGGRFWPDEPLEYHSAESNQAIGVDQLQAQGLTGEGVTVAVIDTGVDATVAPLSDQVTHNVVMLGTQRAKALLFPVEVPSLLVTPVDLGPGSNTDGDGHGSLVAGIVAGDGTGDPSLIGVAPHAEIIGYNVGDRLGTPMAVAAMDHILDHPEWGIDVVNNSYGRAKFSVFDPAEPIHVATKALHDAGITVVFAAGNSGAGVEMNLGSYSVAPWVIGVGATDVKGVRGDFSSTGLPLDNSVAAPLVDGHVSATGDRLGIYRPSVMAPGVSLLGVCPTVSTRMIGCTPGQSTEGRLSGTSFAAPHVAGVAALLRQARPDLTPDQIRKVLEVTASPTSGRDPAWRAGFGVIDAVAAVDLVRSAGFPATLARLHRAAEARLLAARPWRVTRSDLWTTPTPTLVVGGVTELPVHQLKVAKGTDALKVGIATYDIEGTAEYTVVVRDAAGQEVGRTEAIGTTDFGPVGSVLLDLRDSKPAYGPWTLSIEAVAGSNDEGEGDPVGHLVVHAALLQAKR